MQTLSYNQSPVLQQLLKSVDSVRENIILRPLPPKTELRLRWEANLDRIYYSLHLSHNPVTKKESIRVLSTPGKNRAQRAELDVLQYKQGFDYIALDWLANDKPVMPQTIQKLYRIVTSERLTLPDSALMEILVFLQTSSENPLIRAYVSYLQFSQVLPNTDQAGKVVRLIPYIFLYKAGLDFRGLLVLEEYFYTNERLLKELQAVITKGESITAWIEHFINGVYELAVRTEQKLTEEKGSSSMPASFWELTERQKEILWTFDRPGERITNKKIQQQFKISQITASRDLAKMATLGLLFPYGKGRSVYYVKV